MAQEQEAVGEAKQTTGDARFEALTREFLAGEYVAHPVMATAMGIHAYDDSLDNFNRFALRAERDRVRAYLHAIDKISLAELNEENRLDYRLARSSAQQTLSASEQQRWPERHPGAYLDTLFYGLFLLLSREFATAETRAVSVLGRLRALPDALAQAQENLQRPPRLFTELAIESAEAGDAYLRETLPAFTDGLRPNGLRQSLAEATQRARAALAEFTRFLREELLPRSDGDFALGRELYEYYLRVVHFLDRDRENADALIEIGREHIEAAKRQLTALAGEIEPGTGWMTLIDRLKQEHPAADELEDAYRIEMERAREFVLSQALVSFPPNETLAVTETPCFACALFPYAAYVPPAPFEPQQQGTFWVTPISDNASPDQQERQLQGHSRYNIPIIALHEAYPGHHLQFALAAQHSSPFRRHFAQSNLFIEGWALYCEEMMREQGYYSDPRTLLMQQKALLWRACRVVIDVQLHTRQMTLAEAAQFLQTEARIEEAHAWSEVKRYALTPTQPMTYLIGKLALVSLRDEMERRQGARFNLRHFHDRILSYGSVPPTLLREALFSVT
jgi:uncharacterized protein (DUF885 family)